MSAGGWVRRRRWVRLMVKPGRSMEVQRERDGEEEMDRSGLEVGEEGRRVDPSPSRSRSRSRGSWMGGSYPSSVVEMDAEEGQRMIREVWQGDEDDWDRCRHLMRRLGTDGKKLEVWREWLGLKAYDASVGKMGEHETKRKGKQKQKQWTEDSQIMPSEAAKAETEAKRLAAEDRPRTEDIVKVLRANVRLYTLLHILTNLAYESCLFTGFDRLKTSSNHSFTPTLEHNSYAS